MSQSYLKQKVQADQQLSLALTKALREIHSTNSSTIEKVKLGSQRLINYGSCLIPSDYYRNTCRELFNEDRRLVLSLGEIYNRNDVVLDMVELYFRKTLKRLGSNKNASLVTFLKKELGEKAYEAAEKSSKQSLSFTIANLVISSGEFQKSHIRLVNSLSSVFVNGMVMYSKAQVAALAANKLKYQDSSYYYDLYKQNLEMLYFLIEPQMSKIIYQVESGNNSEEVIGDALYGLLKK